MKPMKGIVVAPQPMAVEAGAEILRQGGNAVDAALASGFVQGVVDPFMCGLGGFGAMVIHTAIDRKTTAIGFHAKAGSLAHPEVFSADVVGQIHGHAERYAVKGDVNQVGYRSVAVPGMPAGFEAAHKLFGRLPWASVLEPAIKMAREGFPLPGEVHDGWVEVPEPGHLDGCARVHATKACAEIFAPNSRFLQPGETLRQPDYAATLERLARRGATEFYQGELGHSIAEDFARHGGLFVAADLASYRPTVGPVLCGQYRGFDIRTVPLPAGGIQLIELLNILERLSAWRLFHDATADYVHLVARAMLVTFRNRARYLGDPDFAAVPIQMLCSAEHADEMASLVSEHESIDVSALPYRESPHTTHVSVLDGDGNGVSLTHTLGSASGVVVRGLGFILNNCMYQYHPMPGHPNSIAPGKSRLTGITPTIVTQEGRPWLALGALGGTRIITAVAHVLLNLVDHCMTPVEAVEAPRFHAEGPWLEMEARLYYRLHKALASLGWQLRPSHRSYDRAFAVAHVAMRQPDGEFRGGADPRGGGGIALA